MVVETGPFVGSHHRPWISTMTVEVRGTLTQFKRRAVVRNPSTSLDSKLVNVSRFDIPMPSFTTAAFSVWREAQEQRGRARVMFRDGIQILVERRFLNTPDRKSAPIR